MHPALKQFIPRHAMPEIDDIIIFNLLNVHPTFLPIQCQRQLTVIKNTNDKI